MGVHVRRSIFSARYVLQITTQQIKKRALFVWPWNVRVEKNVRYDCGHGIGIEHHILLWKNYFTTLVDEVGKRR